MKITRTDDALHIDIPYSELKLWMKQALDRITELLKEYINTAIHGQKIEVS